MDAQDFLAIPARATSDRRTPSTLISPRVRAAAQPTRRADRGLPTLLADEGGLSPGLETGRAALHMMLRSIERAGLQPGEDVLIAIDVAATALQLPDGRYPAPRRAEARVARRRRNDRDVGRLGARFFRSHPSRTALGQGRLETPGAI